MKIYNFEVLDIDKMIADAFEIDGERYKLIKVINLGDVEICNKILLKKGITDYYLIKNENKDIGIYVSYFEFYKVKSFLEDKRIPNSTIKLSQFLPERKEVNTNNANSNINQTKHFKSTNIIIQSIEDVLKEYIFCPNSFCTKL